MSIYVYTTILYRLSLHGSYSLLFMNRFANNFYLAGELYCRRDPWDDGQEEEHPKHVRHCPCGSWKVNSD